ncbi:MAG: peptidase T [Chloroflexota bacterium]
MLDVNIQKFLLQEAKTRFLRYVQIDTTSADNSGNHPSTPGQLNLAKCLYAELAELGFENLFLDEKGYVYAILPASPGVTCPAVTFCSHLDTSPSESGAAVKPQIHENYAGGVITFPDDPQLTLSPQESPELKKYIGGNIITASGKTLLGADDKAGIAEIMAALAALKQYPHLSHPELRIVFTPDEEVGDGTSGIDLSRLGKVGYTVDGGDIGELEDECFNALRVNLVFHGSTVHAGYAKNRLVNACAIAARFVAALPEYETPEHTEIREGFYHLFGIKGDENSAELAMILRDFEAEKNQSRLEYLKQTIHLFELRYRGLKVDLTVIDQYQNMKATLDLHPEVTQMAAKAIEAAGLTVNKKAIRGGTDGARLTFMGLPTPNLFTGGLLYHSRKEWIPEIALQKAAETILHLCRLWAEKT